MPTPNYTGSGILTAAAGLLNGPAAGANMNDVNSAVAAAMQALAPTISDKKTLLTADTAAKTTSYTAVPWEVVVVDISAGSYTITLPPASAKWEVTVKVLAASATIGATAATITTQGTDVINIPGNTTLPLRYLNQSKTFASNGQGLITVVGGDTDKTVLDQLYPQTLYTQTTVKAGDALAAATAGTTETAFASRPTIPAGYLVPGMVVEGRGYGAFTQTNLGPTQRPRVRIGPAATAIGSRGLIADGGALGQLLSGTANTLYEWRVMFTVQTVGTAGVLRAAAGLAFVSMASGQAVEFLASTAPAVAGTVTVDTTVDNVLTLTNQFGGAVAGNLNTLTQQLWTSRRPAAQST